MLAAAEGWAEVGFGQLSQVVETGLKSGAVGGAEILVLSPHLHLYCYCYWGALALPWGPAPGPGLHCCYPSSRGLQQ